MEVGRVHATKVVTRSIAIFFLVIGLWSVFWPIDSEEVRANSGGPEGSHTGAPSIGRFVAEPTCMTGCHTGNVLNSSLGSMTITTDRAPGRNYYGQGEDVLITVSITHPNRSRFGFQLSGLDHSGISVSGLSGGIVEFDKVRTQVITRTVYRLPPYGLRQYIQHTSSGIDFSPGRPGSWIFKWRAPEAEWIGPITFFASGVAGDSDGSSSGDFVYTTSLRLDPLPSQVLSVSSAAGFNSKPIGLLGVDLAQDMICSLYSRNLASKEIVATPGEPLPTQMEGTSVEIQDATGNVTEAPLFYISPRQINFLIPSNTSLGPATLLVRRYGATVALRTISIARFSPGLFAANGNGRGVAAAQILRVTGDTYRFEGVAQLNDSWLPSLGVPRLVPKPIDFGSKDDVLYLILYGTGLRWLSSQSAATVTLRGVPLPVLYIGPADGFFGLDQINVGPIPRSLGSGPAVIQFQADNISANPVDIVFQ